MEVRISDKGGLTVDSREGPPVEGIVTSIKEGPHGSYFLVDCEGLGIVTVSLEKGVWQEKSWPERGITVVLSDIRKKRAGWRAYSARFLRPSDKNSLNSKEVESGRAIE
jgi:hypothetical protein